MGNQCCCDESDSKEGLPDGTVMVWRPEPHAKQRLEPSAAELLRKDKQLDAVMDKIVQLQPMEEHPGPQKVPKAVLADSRHPSHLTPAERCFLEKTSASRETQRSPAAESPEGSVGGIDDASAASSFLGRDPSPVQGQMPAMQWVSKYDGEAAPQRQRASKESEATAASAHKEPSPKKVSVKELLHEDASARAAPAAERTEAPKSSATPAPSQTPEKAPDSAKAPPTTTQPAATKPPEPAAQSAAAVTAAPAPATAAATAEEPIYDEADLDVPYVTVQFRLPDGSTQDVYFLTFPFGFDLTKTKPMTVRNVRAGSHAEDLGVEVGWVVQTVGDVDVSNMEARQLLMVLLEQKKKFDKK